ncbi:MAG TPA: glycosyltransferase [Candidatus Dependentiae bacterium]|nr:glycosyltransferase [Candidatus Dependentiae bacterium]HRQ63105.1 glycosyltransferase [Candidatus Dependentiae bacterium]
MNNRSFLYTLFIMPQLIGAQSVVVPNQYLYPGIPIDPTQRISSYPYITGDTIRALCDHIYDETKIPFDPAAVQDGDIVFVNPNYLHSFFPSIHQQINARYILVTHNSTFHAPGSYESYLNDPKLVAWFAKNTMLPDHPKMFPLPLGIANKYWAHGDTRVVDTVRKELPTIQKDTLLCINFDINTPHIGQQERIDIHNAFANKDFVYHAERKPYEGYLRDLARAKFTMSPPGSSLDCHRTWEALLMDCIPIVKHSPLDPLFKDLPVLLIDDWAQVTQEFLEQQYEMLKNKFTHNEKFFADYYIRQLAAVKQAIKMENKNVPHGFGLDFHAAMSNSDRYFHAQILADPNWQQVKALYDTYVIDEFEHAQQPRIPKIIHQVWLGSPFPEKYKQLQQTWLDQHPDWHYILWTDKEIAQLGLINQAAYDVATNYGQKSDIARYEILYRFGGLYVDTDFEALRPHDIFHHICDFYIGSGFGPKFAAYTGLIACVPAHPIVKRCIDTLDCTKVHHKDPIINILYTSGPYHVTRCFLSMINDPSIGRAVVFPVNYFYPWPNTFLQYNSYEQVHNWVRPETFAIHNWYVSWNQGTAPGSK